MNKGGAEGLWMWCPSSNNFDASSSKPALSSLFQQNKSCATVVSHNGFPQSKGKHLSIYHQSPFKHTKTKETSAWECLAQHFSLLHKVTHYLTHMKVVYRECLKIYLMRYTNAAYHFLSHQSGVNEQLLNKSRYRKKSVNRLLISDLPALNAPCVKR